MCLHNIKIAGPLSSFYKYKEILSVDKCKAKCSP